jgi:hypothetical protein
MIDHRAQTNNGYRQELQRMEQLGVGSSSHEELWVPAEQLGEFNRRIEGSIEIIAYFYGEQFNQPIDPESRLPVQIVSRRR